MDSEQFSLCWNNFHNNLSTGFQALLKEEDLVDVTLAAEGRYIKAHKIVLSVCSPYFKELFRVNPCKHPIVILQDVNYSALHNLLQFMYQGEVSVSQDEIPNFMRVAEVLKVKGLTDNANLKPENTNGIPNNIHTPQQSYVGVADKQPIMRRSTPKPAPPPPVKKVMKPMQHLKPLEYSNASPSSMPPVKQPRLDDNIKPPDYMEPLLQPKQEPMDSLQDEHDYREQPVFDERIDMPPILDAAMNSSMGEPSEMKYNFSKAPSDSSVPGGLFFLKSRRGHPVLIHQGHMYTLSHKVDNRSMWVCVKQRTLNCGGCVTTANGPMILSYSGHNHTQLHDVIQRLQAASCSPSPELL